jgi:hypothetical protein
MNPEIKDKWVAALRSGTYEQTTGRLRRDDPDRSRHCCLGVLCEVMELAFLGDQYIYGGESSGYYPVYMDGELGVDFLDEVGFGDDIQQDLIAMNDTNKDDFNKIADYIEKVL